MATNREGHEFARAVIANKKKALAAEALAFPAEGISTVKIDTT